MTKSTHSTKYTRKPISRTFHNIFCEDSTAAQVIVRNAYKELTAIEYRCSSCGNSGIWNGRDLHLQLEHKNGDKHDNRLENLCWLCPNCHSQTDTFCGRNANNNMQTQHTCPCCGTMVKRSTAKQGLCYSCERKMSLVKNECSKTPTDEEFVSLSQKYAISPDYLFVVFHKRHDNKIAKRQHDARKHNQNIYITCPKCGNKMHYKATLCRKCHNAQIDASSFLPIFNITPEFISHLLDTSYLQVASELDVSDNAIRKRLRSAGLPVKRNELYRWYEEQTGTKHSAEIRKLQQQEQKHIQTEQRMKQKEALDFEVVQKTMDGKIIQTYETPLIAAKITGIHSQHIRECCDGIRKTAGGFTWERIS